MRCICGARATYRLSMGGSLERYRCAACSNAYPAPEWQAELLLFKRDEAEDAYRHYCELRARLPHLAPEELGTLPRFAAFASFEQRMRVERRKAS